MDRHGLCPGPAKALQLLGDWAGYLYGSFTCAGEYFGSSNPQDACVELCMPKYMATSVCHLEERREHLGLALAGQLIVVTCRCLSGDVGGAIVGMVIFVIGNQARCSLRVWPLTTYIVVAAPFGIIDTFSLVRSLWTLGTGFVFPTLTQHLLADLQAVSLLIAPAAEIWGASLASESYLDPTMVFLPSPGHSGNFSSSLPLAPAMQYLQPGHGRSQVQGYLGGQNFLAQGLQFFAPSAPYASTASPRASMGDTGGADEDCCYHCGQPIRTAQEGWFGTGAHTDMLYCGRCWASWSSPER